MLKKSLLFLSINIFLNNYLFAMDINIADRGAKGDGEFDNWEIFQRAVDDIANAGGGTLYIPKGTFAIYNKSLVIWGKDITIKGDSALTTTLIKKGLVGYFGDAIDITGKANGYKYFGQFGKGNYNTLQTYTGDNIPAENIQISSIHITSSITSNSRNAQHGNNLGIINSRNITVSNCIISSANQTNVAIVNEVNRSKNGNIHFNSCEFSNSGTHNVRVISYNQGNIVGNNVFIENSRFTNVRNTETLNKEISGKNVHLWYRGAIDSNQTSLSVKNSYFDHTGVIIATQSARNLNITNSTIDSTIEIKQSPKLTQLSRVTIENNVFQRPKFKSNKIINDANYQNISLYPHILSNSPTVRIKNNQMK